MCSSELRLCMQVVTHVAVAGAYAGLALASGTVKIINLQEVSRPALLKLLSFFATVARLLQRQPVDTVP
jgi:hypothetical protein